MDRGQSKSLTLCSHEQYRLQEVLNRLYRSRTRPESIRNNEFLTTAGNSAWANTPSPPVQALPSQPLRNPNGGGWTWGEVQPRILNHHRRMMELGSALAFVDEARQDAEGRRQFPDRVRDMIERNDVIIRNRVGGVMHYINRSLRDPDTGENINNLQNLPGIQLPYDRNVEYIQEGGVGPIGIDAAFVLATQLAGVRYDYVHASAQAAATLGTGAGDFTGSSYFGGNSGVNECLTIDTGFPHDSSTSTSVRSFGVAYQNPEMNYHADARGGYYFTFDMVGLEAQYSEPRKATILTMSPLSALLFATLGTICWFQPKESVPVRNAYSRSSKVSQTLPRASRVL